MSSNKNLPISRVKLGNSINMEENLKNACKAPRRSKK